MAPGHDDEDRSRPERRNAAIASCNLFPSGNLSCRTPVSTRGASQGGPDDANLLASADTWLRLFLVGGLAAGAGVSRCGRVCALGLLHRRQHPSASAAGAVQPSAPRRRARHRLPLLPHLRRRRPARRPAADPHLHDLPFADLDQRADAGAGARRASPTTSRCVWHRVARLPDYVYFRHDIHIAKGVGCVTCHGRVDQMPLTYRAIALKMEFCLDCHRDPAPQLAAASIHHRHGLEAAGDARALGEQLVKQNGIRVGSSTIARVPPMTSGTPRLRYRGNPPPACRTSGKRFWTSLEEIVDEPEFRRLARSRVSRGGRDLPSARRRAVLKLMGASLLLAGLAGCGEERSDLALPYVNQPEDLPPGVPRYYATAVLRRLCAAGAGHDLCGPADQARRQSRSSGDAGPQRRLHAGGRAAALRSGPFARRRYATASPPRGRRFERALAACAPDWSEARARACAC